MCTGAERPAASDNHVSPLRRPDDIPAAHDKQRPLRGKGEHAGLGLAEFHGEASLLYPMERDWGALTRARAAVALAVGVCPAGAA
jgi:hypothetical protein